MPGGCTKFYHVHGWWYLTQIFGGQRGWNFLTRGLLTIKVSTFITKGLGVLMTYEIATNKTFTHGKERKKI